MNRKKTKSAFTKTNYILMAVAFHKAFISNKGITPTLFSKEQRQELVEILTPVIEMFKNDNPKFNQELFIFVVIYGYMPVDYRRY